MIIIMIIIIIITISKAAVAADAKGGRGNHGRSSGLGGGVEKVAPVGPPRLIPVKPNSAHARHLGSACGLPASLLPDIWAADPLDLTATASAKPTALTGSRGGVHLAPPAATLASAGVDALRLRIVHSGPRVFAARTPSQRPEGALEDNRLCFDLLAPALPLLLNRAAECGAPKLRALPLRTAEVWRLLRDGKLDKSALCEKSAQRACELLKQPGPIVVETLGAGSNDARLPPLPCFLADNSHAGNDGCHVLLSEEGLADTTRREELVAAVKALHTRLGERRAKLQAKGGKTKGGKTKGGKMGADDGTGLTAEASGKKAGAKASEAKAGGKKEQRS